ncbi:hypothetical protein EI94DRAFT_828165 [Lactarius quietus]|nr:hypothetical protein EI94DRAFT_828165 [Lactarius quietus]
MLPKRSIADIDRKITLIQNSLSLYPRSHLVHITCVYTLAEERWRRYQQSHEKEDLVKSTLHSTEAIFLPPIPRVGYNLNNIFQLLFHLAMALKERSEKLGQPEVIRYSIEYLRYLRGLPLDSFDVSRNLVTTALIHALGIQVDLEAADGTRNIKEMVVLFRELLTSNSSAEFPDTAFIILGGTVNTEVALGRLQSLDEVAECLREAVKTCPPGSYHAWFVLAFTLSFRFKESHSNDDLRK